MGLGPPPVGLPAWLRVAMPETVARSPTLADSSWLLQFGTNILLSEDFVRLLSPNVRPLVRQASRAAPLCHQEPLSIAPPQPVACQCCAQLAGRPASQLTRHALCTPTQMRPQIDRVTVKGSKQPMGLYTYDSSSEGLDLWSTMSAGSKSGKVRGCGAASSGLPCWASCWGRRPCSAARAMNDQTAWRAARLDKAH